MPQFHIFDLEVYPNFFYALFYNLETEKYDPYRIEDLEELKAFLRAGRVLIGYNSRNYDSVILRSLVDNRVKTCEQIYELSVRIINNTLTEDERKLRWSEHPWDEIDLIAIHPSYAKDWSLKKHQVRLRWPDVRDLPYKYDKQLTEEEIANVIEYCKNDVDSTRALYEDYKRCGVLDTAVKIQQEYPFIGKQAFYLPQSQIGSRVMSHLYRTAAGLGKYQPIAKPERLDFEPSKEIHKDIVFLDKRNQETLEYLKGIPPENVIKITETRSGKKNTKGPGDWAAKHLRDVRFYIGDLAIPFGVGGIHTNRNQGRYDGTLIDFDVTSYYPNTINKLKRIPVGLTSQWLQQYLKPYHKRLELKRAGDKVGADVMKIVINSVYGQLNSPPSESFDPAQQMAVTINGQLFLLMLAERFAEAGFFIVAANTDGITVDVGTKGDLANRIADEWCELTGFELGRDLYHLYVATSINNYFAVNKATGAIKRKGSFGTGTGLSPSIIPEAVIAHYKDGMEVAEFIAKADNLFDFLYVGTSKADKVLWKNATLQKTNRWYRSTDGAPITLITGDRQSRLSGSEQAVPVNKITDSTISPDLDRAHYIDEANKIIRGIEAQLPTTKADTNELIYDAQKLADQGLTVQPKGRADNPKANLPGEIPSEAFEKDIEEYPWYRYNGIGAITGPAFTTIAIDIDHLNEAVTSGLFKFTQKSKGHLCVWHGEGSGKEVASGQKRGTMIFKYAGTDLKTTGANFIQQYGFEILYGEKIVQLRGVHGSGEAYRYQGTLKDLPPRLLEFLKGVYSEAPSRLVSNENDPTPICQHDEENDEIDDVIQTLKDRRLVRALVAFRKVANKDPEYVRIGGRLRVATEFNPCRLVGFCPGEHQHTSPDNGEPFSVHFIENKFYARCFHKSCITERNKWARRVSKLVSLPDEEEAEVEPVVSINIVPPEGIEEESVMNALIKDEKQKLVISGTGSGKSYNTVRIIAQKLRAEDQEKKKGEPREKYLIAVSSKDQMGQMMSEFCEALDTDDPTRHGIDIIESTGQMTVRKAKSRSDVRPITRVAITHFTYLNRKGDSPFHYALAKWITPDTHVWIDEVDAFLESQTRHLHLGWRGKRKTVSGRTSYQAVVECPVSSGTGNCSSCVMKKYQGHTYTVNPIFNLLEYRQRTVMDEGTRLRGEHPHRFF